MPPKVDKEIVFFLANAGKDLLNGDTNYFEKAKEVMTLIIEKKIFLRDHDEVGIMLAAHADDNENEKDKSIKLLCHNHVPSWETVKDVQKINKSDKNFNDWINPLTDTLQHIEQNLEADRIILILLFDCHSLCSGIESINMQHIVESIQNLGIQLLWIGSKPLNDLSDDKLNESEKALMKIMKLVNGRYMMVDETIPSLRIFKKLKSRYMAWNCDLELGPISIPISMYNQATRPMKTTTFQTIRTKIVDGVEKSVVIRPEQEYVDRYKQAHAIEDTISGYMYGRQCIPVPEDDKVGMNYKGGPKSFVVFGFVPENAINLEDLSGDTSRIVVPQFPPSEDDSLEPLYCLAQAMKDAERVAIVRRTYRESSCPKMGLLFPHIDLGEPWGFIYIELVYAEERRVQQSHPLISVKNRLTKEKENAVGNLIDSMMLTSSDNESEPFYPGNVHSPGLQHLYNCLIHRALHPDKPIPEMEEYLKKLIEPPESIKINSEPVLNKLRDLFPIPAEPIPMEKSVDTAPEIPLPVLVEVKKMELKVEAEEKMECVSLAEETNVDLDELFDEDM